MLFNYQQSTEWVQETGSEAQPHGLFHNKKKSNKMLLQVQDNFALWYISSF